VAIGLADGNLAFCKYRGASTSMQILKAHQNGTQCLEWSEGSNGERVLATGGQDGLVKIWNICADDDCRLVPTELELKCPSSWIQCLKWLPGHFLAIGVGKRVMIWSTNSNLIVREFACFPATVNHLEYAPIMKALAVSSYGAVQIIHLNDLANALSVAQDDEVMTHLEEKGSVLHTASCAMNTSDGDELVIASGMQDGLLMVWALRSGELFQKLKLSGYSGKLSKVVIDSKCRHIASTGRNIIHNICFIIRMLGAPSIVLWDMGIRHDLLHRGELGDKLCFSRDSEKSMATDVAFHPSAPFLIAGFKNGHVAMWNLTGRTILAPNDMKILLPSRIIAPPTGSAVLCVGWSSRGKNIVVTFEGGKTFFYDFKN
jgi:WD40 repeat protein